MKTWITYLTAFFLGLATVLLLGDSSWLPGAFTWLSNAVINIGCLLSLLMVAISFTSAVASMRKDHLGGRVTSWSLLWSVITAFVLCIVAALAATFFPTAFPTTSTTGAGTISADFVTSSVALAANVTVSGNMMQYIAQSGSFLLPVILLALVIGCALKPNADTIRPAYITLNSLSEAMFRLARAFNVFGYLGIYITSTWFIESIFQEGSFFTDPWFALMLVCMPLFLTLVVLPVLFLIISKGKMNPYKVIFRNIPAQVAALTSGSNIFTMSFLMSGERHNTGVQKRIAAGTVTIHHVITRAGTAAIATFSILALVPVVTGVTMPLSGALLIATACALASFISSLSGGFELMFITVAALGMLKTDLFSAQVAMLGMLPLLGGLGALVDSQTALLGGALASIKSGTSINPPYKDAL